MIIENETCPFCGEKSLRIGQYGDHVVCEDYYRVTCDCCNFTCPEGSADYGEASIAFEDWVKNRKTVIDEEDERMKEVCCENCLLFDRCFPIADKNRKRGYRAFINDKMVPHCRFEYNNVPSLFINKYEYKIIKNNT